MVNERLARLLWPGQNPIGKRIKWGLDIPQNPNPWITVVGVVADVADGALAAEPFLHAYEPFSQFPDVVLNNVRNAFGRHIELAARTEGDPRTLAPAVRAELRHIDDQLAIESISTMDDRLASTVAPRRFSVMTLGAFAIGALLLAAIGLYGLLVFTTGERRREIAVRLALGARPGAILRMVIGQGLMLVLIGWSLGTVIAYVATRAIGSLLYRTEATDVLAFGTASVVLVLMALIACALPAWRASRVAALTALRAE